MSHPKILSEIASLFSGLPASKIHKKSQPDCEEVTLLTSDAYLEGGLIDSSKLKTVWIDRQTGDKFFLQEGDIIVPLKGIVFKATLIDKNALNAKRIITSSNHAIIRPDVVEMIPEVLHFYLDSHWFKTSVIESTKKNFILINLKRLRKVSIPVPEKITQVKLQQQYYDAKSLKSAMQELIVSQNKAIESKFLHGLFSHETRAFQIE